MKNFFSLGGISAAIVMQTTPTFAASPTTSIASLVQAHRQVQIAAGFSQNISPQLIALPRTLHEVASH